jgi:hypothetical protein
MDAGHVPVLLSKMAACDESTALATCLADAARAFRANTHRLTRPAAAATKRRTSALAPGQQNQQVALRFSTPL